MALNPDVNALDMVGCIEEFRVKVFKTTRAPEEYQVRVDMGCLFQIIVAVDCFSADPDRNDQLQCANQRQHIQDEKRSFFYKMAHRSELKVDKGLPVYDVGKIVKYDDCQQRIKLPSKRPAPAITQVLERELMLSLKPFD
jgi:hypothetical protein